MIRRKLPKKEREMILLRDFISNESLGLRVKRIDENETPDFVIQELTKAISVELTQLIHPGLMEREMFIEKLVDRAHKLFKEKYKAHLYVLITFSDIPINSTANGVSKLAEEVFRMVEEIYLPNRKHEFHISANYFDSDDDWVERITISNNLEFEHWQPFGSFRVNEIDTNWVKKVINQKEQLIDKYNTLVDEKWLLLVSNFGFRSDTHSFHYLKQEKFQSRFDKIYLFKYREKEIYQLK